MKRRRADRIIKAPFITFDPKTRAYAVTNEAVRALSEIDDTETIAVVGIGGSFRTGKSALERMLFPGTGFKTSSAVDPCTRGIDLAITKDARGRTTIVLDSEGFNSGIVDSQHDNNLFSLLLLTCSTFLYNNMGAINDSAARQLHLTTKSALHLARNERKEEESFKFGARFVWVARDFSLALISSTGESIPEHAYLRRFLESDTGDVDIETMRRELLSLFDLTSFCLPKPCASDADMRGSELRNVRPEFTKKVEDLRRYIAEQPPLTMRGKTKITASMFVDMTKRYVSAINDGALPSIRNTWSILCVSHNKRLFESFRSETLREIENRTDLVVFEPRYDDLRAKIVDIDENEFRRFREDLQTTIAQTFRLRKLENEKIVRDTVQRVVDRCAASTNVLQINHVFADEISKTSAHLKTPLREALLQSVWMLMKDVFTRVRTKYETSLDDLRKTIETRDAQLRDVRSQLETRETSFVQEKTDLRTRLDTRTKELEDARRALDLARSKAARTAAASASSSDTRKEDVERLEEQARSLEVRLKTAEGACESRTKELEDARERSRKIESELNTTRERAENAEQLVVEQRKSLSDMEALRAEIEETRKSAETLRQDCQAKIDASVEKARKRERDLSHLLDLTRENAEKARATLVQQAKAKMLELRKTQETLSATNASLRDDLERTKADLLREEKNAKESRDVVEKTTLRVDAMEKRHQNIVDKLREEIDQSKEKHLNTRNERDAVRLDLKMKSEELRRALHKIADLEQAPNVSETRVRPLKLQISGLEKEARRRDSEIDVLRNTNRQLEKELNLALIEHRTKIQEMEGTFNREIAVLRFRLESSGGGGGGGDPFADM